MNKFNHSLPQWVRALCGAIHSTTDVSYWRFIARRQVRHYVGYNLDDSKLVNRVTLTAAIRGYSAHRSAYGSAKEGFRAEYAIARSVASGAHIRAA